MTERIVIYDSDGIRVNAGDIVHFSYGIPPVGVDGAVVDEDGILFVLTPGHNLAKTELKNLEQYVGSFYIVSNLAS